ncbi:MAG TPA: hypothetical protein ENI06_01840 [Spirochaetales bacterium]|nr:hypothetical protein [Spirochaetales bacterium]
MKIAQPRLSKDAVNELTGELWEGARSAGLKMPHVVRLRLIDIPSASTGSTAYWPAVCWGRG